MVSKQHCWGLSKPPVIPQTLPALAAARKSFWYPHIKSGSREFRLGEIYESDLEVEAVSLSSLNSFLSSHSLVWGELFHSKIYQIHNTVRRRVNQEIKLFNKEDNKQLSRISHRLQNIKNWERERYWELRDDIRLLRWCRKLTSASLSW